MPEYKLYFDGACTPNPGGTASYGFVLTLNDADEIDRGNGVIGRGKGMTDVFAENFALTYGLLSFVRHLNVPSCELKILGDSKFLVEKIKAGHESKQLKAILDYVRSLNVKIDVLWIPREHNMFCDTLSKKLRKLF